MVTSRYYTTGAPTLCAVFCFAAVVPGRGAARWCRRTRLAMAIRQILPGGRTVKQVAVPPGIPVARNGSPRARRGSRPVPGSRGGARCGSCHSCSRSGRRLRCGSITPGPFCRSRSSGRSAASRPPRRRSGSDMSACGWCPSGRRSSMGRTAWRPSASGVPRSSSGGPPWSWSASRWVGVVRSSGSACSRRASPWFRARRSR